ncbi:hypothetical protein F183_A16080 [Bryobacterales bacterium F-183]|nr:hypothetical protein F183_A16080 [Bryobacterales bacterium F-183]
MCTRSSSLFTVALVVASAAFAQPQQGTSANFNGSVVFDANSPVAQTSVNWTGSTAQPRGGALVIDVHAALVLKNLDQRRIRGITLSVGVGAHESSPGSRGSVSLPTLDVAPGDTFPVRIDLNLLRPLQQGTGPLVEVKLDGVLFDDLSFIGSDLLQSRRALTIWELEARRDRQHFRAMLEKGGADALRGELMASAQRAQERQQGGVQMVRGGRVTNIDTERRLQFAFVQMPDAPVEALAGAASVSNNEARKPWFEIRNKSGKPVNFVEMGWIVRDANGRQFLAGTVPSDSKLQPGQKQQVTQDTLVRFPNGAAIGAMSGFVNHVEFGDGKFWIPSREAIAQSGLRSVMSASPEEQRLVRMYQRRGLNAVVEELKRLQ